MRPSVLRVFGALAATVTLSGCGYFDSRNAHKAQFEMVGMTSYDVQACAGLPGSTKKLNDTTELWQYDGTQSTPTLSTYPGLIPAHSIFSIYESAFRCGVTTRRMVLRLDHDRASEVLSAGYDD